MKVIYIAGKFRGKTPWDVHRNVVEAEYWAFRVAECGVMPLCPHTNTAHFDGTQTDEFWLEGTKELLRRCDALYLTPNWIGSFGSRAEMREAVKRGMPIFQDLMALSEWLAGRVTGLEDYELFALQARSEEEYIEEQKRRLPDQEAHGSHIGVPLPSGPDRRVGEEGA